MKKNLLMVAVMAILSIAAAVAQPRAIGGRITEGLEVSYQHSLGSSNMLSIDGGFTWNRIRYHYTDGGVRYKDWWWGYGIEAVVTYDWINPFGADFPTISKGDWNWYMGVGGGANFAFRPLRVYGYDYNAAQIAIGAAGRVGVEYNFWFPLQLSVDWRPVIGPSFSFVDGRGSVNYYDSGLYVGAISLGVRYKF